uniref:40S ribosomal protein S15 n=2 Tax=Meloidogyne incognita group TaxID=654580 RepID=A0A915MBA7_MELJA
MTDVAEQKKKRTFRKFVYRGVDLEQLLEMNDQQFNKLLPSRQRRKMNRGLNRKHKSLLVRLRKAKLNAPELTKPECVKTHLRDMIVLPEMVGCVLGIHSGKAYNQVEIRAEMIGHYLGEFSITYKPVKHGRPGIGATHSSRFIPLKKEMWKRLISSFPLKNTKYQLNSFRNLSYCVDPTLGLTEEQKEIQKTAKEFAKNELYPYMDEWDAKGELPLHAFKKAGELGFGAIYCSEEYNGAGLGRYEAALAFEQLAGGCTSTAAYMAVHNMVPWMIDRFGNEEQKRKYIPDLASFKKLASYGLTEPGSDERKFGWCTQPTRIITFEDVKVPITNRVGELGQGFTIAMEGLNGGTNSLSITSRLLLREACLHVENDTTNASSYSAMAKMYITDEAFNVVNQAVQMYGGYGMLKDYPLQQYLRDCRVHQIIEGTNEIMRLVVARNLLSNEIFNEM